jgi:anti-sigma factor RsiW
VFTSVESRPLAGKREATPQYVNNPCVRSRKAIAWLAVGALDRARTESLEKHLAECEACRTYHQKMTGITDELSIKEIAPESGCLPGHEQPALPGIPSKRNLGASNRLTAMLAKWRVTTAVTLAVLATFFTLSVRHSNHHAAAAPAAGISHTELFTTSEEGDFEREEAARAAEDVRKRKAPVGVKNVRAHE